MEIYSLSLFYGFDEHKYIYIYIYIYIHVFRFFLSLETYQNHIQLHQINCNLSIVERLASTESIVSTLKIIERPKESKKGEQVHENIKSLTCSTCGKV